MSSFALYDGSVPHATAAMNVLLHLLDQVEDHAMTSNVPIENLLHAKLAEDMFPFTVQVLIACDIAAQIAARLQGLSPLARTGSNSSWAIEDMRKWVRASLEGLEKVDRQKVVDPDTKTTFNQSPTKSIESTAYGFVNGYALPNMYFHIVTAFGILRNQGVQVGKQDYLDHFLGRYLE